MATPISRAKRLVKMLERLNKQPYLYDEDQVKLIKEQLKIAKNELFFMSSAIVGPTFIEDIIPIFFSELPLTKSS